MVPSYALGTKQGQPLMTSQLHCCNTKAVGNTTQPWLCLCPPEPPTQQKMFIFEQTSIHTYILQITVTFLNKCLVPGLSNEIILFLYFQNSLAYTVCIGL